MPCKGRSKTAARKKSGADVLRETKKAASLAGWRSNGTAEAAGAACKSGANTIREWFRIDPDYRAMVQAAIEEYSASVAQETHNAIHEHVRAAVKGEMVTTKKGVEGGKAVDLKERVTLNPALARLALTRAEPRFTHPQVSDQAAESTAGKVWDADDGAKG